VEGDIIGELPELGRFFLESARGFELFLNFWDGWIGVDIFWDGVGEGSGVEVVRGRAEVVVW
jgi:hypothetical protein